MVSRMETSPPKFTPLPYGLLSVVQSAPSGDVHWKGGIQYQTRCVNEGATTYDECIAVTGSGAGVGAPPPPPTKTGTADLVMRAATPFAVYARFDCAPVGVNDAMEIAKNALAQTASWQVERAFWTGVAASQDVVFPHLAATTEIMDAGVLLQSAAVTGTAADIICGLGFLEQQLADCYNGVGVIHVPRKALPALKNASLVEKNGSKLYTANGNLVAVGSGYPGTGPAGQDPGQCGSWLYATGAVFAINNQARINSLKESIDRANNTVQMMAEQTYLIGWDCCHAAIEVDVGALAL